MEPGVVNQLTSPLSPRQRDALVSLLADDDPAVYNLVRQKILAFGPPARSWLRPHLLSNDPVLRRRVHGLVNYWERQHNDERFLAFCLNHGEELDLERATGLLALTEYPDINVEGYQALYDAWAEELRARIDLSDGPDVLLNDINSFLFGDLGFLGEDHYGDNPENGYLNRVVDRRAGNPISLCAIYLFITRRLRLPVTGIGLPGHFLCRYQSSTREVYIDCFRAGKFWTKADCIRHLLNANRGLQEGYLAPVTSRRILLRMCANLHQTYSSLDQRDEAARVQRYLVALAK
jgi:regulator of sirC expression with transglutaminase-like and TPR domain